MKGSGLSYHVMEPNPKQKSPETRDFKELLGKKITNLASLVSIILFCGHCL